MNAQKLDDIPGDGKPCYLVLRPTSYTIPGDERSRTNPGHGYPAHTVNAWDIYSFDTKDEWEKEIKSLTKEGYKFKAIQGHAATVTTHVVVNIN